MNKQTFIKATGMSILAAGMTISSVAPVFAKTAGTITINGKSGQSLTGKTFNVYNLFTLEKSGSDDSAAYNYTVVEKYRTVLQNVTGKEKDQDIADYISKLTDAEARTFSENIRTAIKNAGIAADLTKTCSEAESASATISVSDMGYYLVDETTDVSGKNAAASLVMLQTTEPDAEVTIKSDYPTVTKKIQEDDDNVGWNDIGDYEIGQTIPYKFTSAVPDMSAYDTYKFVFHDKADAALTMDTSSIQVKIGKTAVDPSKYTVTSEDGDTFDITFDDLKTAVDGIATGDSIVVTVNGQINENAVGKTGRAGAFENSVMLEFSNDARDGGEGSTGKTPWDTVVAYTYKLKGIKTDDTDVAAALANAEFKLYSDSDCTKEVKTVKDADGNYVVSQTATEGAAITSDSDGIFNIVGIDHGTYYLKEKKAPTGYKLLESAIAVTVTPTFTTDRDSYEAGSGTGDKVLTDLTSTIANGTLETVSAANGEVYFKVTNHKGSKLPATGGIAGAMIMLSAGAVIVAKKRKDAQED